MQEARRLEIQRGSRELDKLKEPQILPERRVQTSFNADGRK